MLKSLLLKLLYNPSNIGSMLPVRRRVAKVEYLKVSLVLGGATPRNMSPRKDGKEKLGEVRLYET
jgi:hypothetical protein